MSSTFKKKVEDFICQKCGVHIQGDGFTNHCPECLWGKHVDIFPGDREELCRGMMEPIEIISENKQYSVVHICQKCGKKRKNKISERDNFGAIFRIIKLKAENFSKK